MNAKKEWLLSRRRFGALCAGAGAGALALGRAALAGAAERMATRPIPSSGEALPVVGVGTWQTFDVGSGAAARAPLAELLAEMFKAAAR